MDNKDMKTLQRIKEGLDKAAAKYKYFSNDFDEKKDIITENVKFSDIAGHYGYFYEIRCETPLLNIVDPSRGESLGSWQMIDIYRYKDYSKASRKYRSLCKEYDKIYMITLIRSHTDFNYVTAEINLGGNK